MEPLGGHVKVALKSPFLLFPCSYPQQRPLQKKYNNNKYTIIYMKWIQSMAEREEKKRREINMAPTVAEGNHIPSESFLFCWMQGAELLFNEIPVEMDDLSRIQQ